MPKIEVTSHRLIGGAFGLPVASPKLGGNHGTQWSFLRPDAVLVANARSAFWLLANTLRPRCVWLPSYLCDTIVKGFQEAGCRIRFFPLDAQLRCDDSAWIAEVGEGDLVLRINYFGFINRDPVYAAVQARGACLIDDAAQAFLTADLGADARFIVFSPRKFVGVPDGGCLIPLEPPTFIRPRLEPAPASWWNRAHAATQLRREFDRSGAETPWFAEFQAAEQMAPIGAYAMSETSRQLLHSGFDFDEIALARRKNYLQFLERLGDFALFPHLPDGAVPIGFPVIVEERERVRQALFGEKIFPPVHWPIDGLVPISFTASHRLARTIMTIPCDQRYDSSDVNRAADCFIAAV